MATVSSEEIFVCPAPKDSSVNHDDHERSTLLNYFGIFVTTQFTPSVQADNKKKLITYRKHFKQMYVWESLWKHLTNNNPCKETVQQSGALEILELQ